MGAQAELCWCLQEVATHHLVVQAVEACGSQTLLARLLSPLRYEHLQWRPGAPNIVVSRASTGI